MTEYKHDYETRETTARCECGKVIELYDQYLGASECPHCGRWHNLFGELLNDPSTWSRGDDW